jgi:hypothetical protein
MTDNLVRQLVQGLVVIGESRDLQVFTAGDGAALLDWTAPEHRVMTVWMHGRGVEIRVGATVHALVAVEGPEDVDWLLQVLRRVVVAGAWFETYVVDPATARPVPLGWRLGVGTSRSISSPTAARKPTAGVRVHRTGEPWGRSPGATGDPAG